MTVYILWGVPKDFPEHCVLIDVFYNKDTAEFFKVNCDYDFYDSYEIEERKIK